MTFITPPNSTHDPQPRPVARQSRKGTSPVNAKADHEHLGVREVVAGTNITITGPPERPTIAAAGGGGVTSVNGLTGTVLLNANENYASILTNATSAGDAGNRSDHFLGTSLDAKWTETKGTLPSAVVGNSCFGALITGTGEHLVTQPYTPSGAFRVEARMYCTRTDTAAGIYVSDISTAFGPNEVLCDLNVGNIRSDNLAVAWTAYYFTYLAIERDGGNNWTVQGSMDRHLWVTIDNFALALSVAYLGFRFSGAANQSSASVDFIDVVL